MTPLERLLHNLPAANLFKNTFYVPVSLSGPASQSMDIESTQSLHAFIFNQFDAQAGSTGVGGYLEERRIYGRAQTTADFATAHGEHRTIHLGIDFWAFAGTSVFAPIDGRVHSKSYNPRIGQYGGCIILEHNVQGTLFHTLYGHLSLESILGCQEKQNVKQGQFIGYIGEPEENGAWPPHLHFQIVADTEGQQGDYYGVAPKSGLPYYRNNCPNPNLLLKLTYDKQPGERHEMYG